MDTCLMWRLVRRTDFSFGQISGYVARAVAAFPGVAADVLAYNILEAAAMNIDLDILGAPQPTTADFDGTGIF